MLLQCTLYIVHCKLYSVSVHCTMFSVHWKLYTVNCTVYTVNCTVYTVNCKVLTVNCKCTLYNVNCIRFTVNWTEQFLNHHFTTMNILRIKRADELPMCTSKRHNWCTLEKATNNKKLHFFRTIWDKSKLMQPPTYSSPTSSKGIFYIFRSTIWVSVNANKRISDKKVLAPNFMKYVYFEFV